MDETVLFAPGMTVAFVPPGEGAGDRPLILDFMKRAPNGSLISHYCGETLEQLREHYPTVVLKPLDEASRIATEYFVKPPRPTTEEQFWNALECLPPDNWVRRNGAETFMVSERIYNDVTDIYCRLGSEYWVLSDHIALTHDAIVAKVRVARASQVTA